MVVKFFAVVENLQSSDTRNLKTDYIAENDPTSRSRSSFSSGSQRSGIFGMIQRSMSSQTIRYTEPLKGIDLFFPSC